MRYTWGSSKTILRLGFAAGLVFLLLIGLLGMLVVLPAVSPNTGAAVADWIRGVMGPRPVAFLEGESLSIQDAFNQFLAAHGGAQSISLLPNPTVVYVPRVQRPAPAPAASGAVKPAIPLPPATNVVTAAPQIGWQPFGPSANGSPSMAEAMVALDPTRSYAGIVLVRIDLSQLQLHMMPGTSEPSHAPNVASALPNRGVIPLADQANLVAAFNGGFKAVNGQYGMMVDGVTLLPPQPGLATLAIYKDGHIAVGVWGQDIGPSPDILAFRQNCPPLIQNGQVDPQVNVENQALWGNTIGNKQVSWRTGLGITQDGRYLIYAVGNATTVPTLAYALQQAGAYNAMQLDINRPFARFVTYQQTGSPSSPLQAAALLKQMESDPTLYLVPHSRDFFYLTTR